MNMQLGTVLKQSFHTASAHVHDHERQDRELHMVKKENEWKNSS